MKRVLVVALGLIGATFAATAQAQVLGQDSVVGSAHDCAASGPCPAVPSTVTLFTAWTADAHSDPGGRNPSGTMTWTDRIAGDSLRTDAFVTCLSVTGRVAIIGVAGTTTSARFSYSLPIAGLLRITDGGGPASSLDTFERAIQSPIPPLPPPSAPTDCSSFPAGTAVFYNEQGDLVVHDSPPLPATKAQCDRGAWRQYDFKSHGECVRFVRHQAHQACIFERVAHGPAAFRAKYGRGQFQLNAMGRCIRVRTG